MYKTSPNWQLIYKKQCLTRLTAGRHDSRSRLVDRFRNIDLNDGQQPTDAQPQTIVDQVMHDVWNQFNNGEPPPEDPNITDLIEQIRQELIEEESTYWEELIQGRGSEEVEWLVANRESVVCFFCQKSSLEIRASPNDSKSELFCPNCGFSFVSQIPLSIAEIQRRVDQIMCDHSSVCTNPCLKFDLINDCSNNGSNNVIVVCEVCHKSDLIFNHIQ